MDVLNQIQNIYEELLTKGILEECWLEFVGHQWDEYTYMLRMMLGVQNSLLL